MQQNLVQNFFTTRSWSFWKQHRKGTVKGTPKIEKYVYIYIYIYIYILYIYCEYLLCPQSNPSGSFLQQCISFVEQRLKFSHFESSIIP